MDSKHARRGALVVMATVTAFGGTVTTAQAESELHIDTVTTGRTESEPHIHEGLWKAPVVKQRVWRTTAVPAVVPRQPLSRNKKIALDHVVQRSWSYRQFRCLDNLWTRESGWNHRAQNSSSGAYGIPQALPAGKMQGAGSDWRSNPETQIRWGLTYIKGRYGRPCGAWGHFRSHNWY
ncbi:transglycosylase SLT domain-containing protein [Nonomuraea cavernae]|uniref:aggregation-promoting factor C-terminal-like domain-containing protein n=1 Tax=Nonomuraea cavernae TaxID=2045107 RepID=UPI0033CECFD3